MTARSGASQAGTRASIEAELGRLRAMLGQATVDHDEATLAPLRALGATFDRPGAVPAKGEPVPAGWHVAYFQPIAPRAELGEDGLPLSTDVLPEISLPTRVHAGSLLEFAGDILVGDSLRRETRFSDVRIIEGRSGAMLLAEISREISTPRGVAVTDRRRLIFRDSVANGGPRLDRRPPDHLAAWSRSGCADPLTLFRYSAAIMATHRIHYDHPYATKVENYPGLVVHGPYLQQLLIDLALDHSPGRRIRSFEMRTRAPVFAGEAFELCGAPTADGAALWISVASGGLAMEARAVFASGGDQD